MGSGYDAKKSFSGLTAWFAEGFDRLMIIFCTGGKDPYDPRVQ
jgi:hypothetical protein